MANPYRAELQLLFDAAESFAEASLGHHCPWRNALNRARALLAQPVAEEPTDEELANAAREALDSYRYSYSSELPYFLSEDSSEYEPLMLVIRAAVAADRARWGRPTPQPVPTSERLPGPEDCIFPTGECWWFDPHADGAWYVDTFQGNYTHWLPANALPTPDTQ